MIEAIAFTDLIERKRKRPCPRCLNPMTYHGSIITIEIPEVLVEFRHSWVCPQHPLTKLEWVDRVGKRAA